MSAVRFDVETRGASAELNLEDDPRGALSMCLFSPGCCYSNRHKQPRDEIAHVHTGSAYFFSSHPHHVLVRINFDCLF